MPEQHSPQEEQKNESETSLQEQDRFRIKTLSVLITSLEQLEAAVTEKEAQEPYVRNLFEHPAIKEALNSQGIHYQEALALPALIARLQEQVHILQDRPSIFIPEVIGEPVRETFENTDSVERTEVMNIQERINALDKSKEESLDLIESLQEEKAKFDIFKVGRDTEEFVEVLATVGGSVEIFFGAEKVTAEHMSEIEETIKDCQRRLRLYGRAFTWLAENEQKSSWKNIFSSKKEKTDFPPDEEVRMLLETKTPEEIKGLELRTLGALPNWEKQLVKSSQPIHEGIAKKQEALTTLLLTTGQVEFEGSWGELVVQIELGVKNTLKSLEKDVEETSEQLKLLEAKRQKMETKAKGK